MRSAATRSHSVMPPHRESPEEHAMVLIGPIIIAVVLMALRVPGVPGMQ